jgi:predicted lipoprotein with Yx(FWY)xxD motif
MLPKNVFASSIQFFLTILLHGSVMKNIISPALGGVAVALLAACSGGGSSGTTPVVNSAPVVSTSTSAPQTASTLKTANVNGSPAFVTANQQPVYVDGADKTDESFCTSVGNCLGLWPAVLAPSGTLSAGFTAFTRSDNGELQLAYNGQPLYTFIDDQMADVATGIGIADPASDGGTGTFTLAVPSTAATAAPTAKPTSAPSSPYSTTR